MCNIGDISTIRTSPQDRFAAEKTELAGDKLHSAGPALPLVTQFLDAPFRHVSSHTCGMLRKQAGKVNTAKMSDLTYIHATFTDWRYGH
jgi:hypothetical protein